MNHNPFNDMNDAHDEINVILTDPDEVESFKKLKVSIDRDSLNPEYSVEYNLIEFYEFCLTESSTWESYIVPGHPNYFRDILSAFKSAIQSIEKFILESYRNTWNEYTRIEHFNTSERKVLTNNSIFLLKFDYPEIVFLKSIWVKFPNSFEGARNYLFKNSIPSNSTINDIEGYFFAFNFRHGNNRELSQEHIESESIYQIKKEFSEYINITKKSHTEMIEGFDSEQSKLLEDTKLSKVNIEKTYQEVLKLKEPALFWKDRAAEMRTEGLKSLNILIGIVGFCVASLIIVLIFPPEQIFSSFLIKDKSTAIRWSITFITLLSFLAYIIGIVSKTMFSSFHIARDCDERYTLTYFYLSLLKDSEIDTKGKELIIQSLFSRTDTGLLKGDSSPTMPGDVLSKLINK